MRVVVVGGTGFIGASLVGEFVRTGAEVVVLTRQREHTARRLLGRDDVAIVQWAPEGGVPLSALRGAEVVVNLAGSTIAQRWTAGTKRLILASRLAATDAIVAGLKELPAAERPQTLINSSAVGYYGPRGDEIVTEEAAAGTDFLADVCRRWEEAALGAEAAGVRVVLLRTGLVLGDGGALRQMMLPFRFFVGGPLGSGLQWMPWIHIDDCVGIIRFAAENDALHGPVNVSAPQPVRNRDFARALGKAMGRPAFFPAPAFAMRLVLGEMAVMVLTGQRAVPRAALDAGYEFKHTDLDATLRDVVA